MTSNPKTQALAVSSWEPPQPPAIGEHWPEQGGTYAGAAPAEEGLPKGYLVLLDSAPPQALMWNEADAWAASLGAGARLPTRLESAQLYDNLQDVANDNEWHWSGAHRSGFFVWAQNFSQGGQFYFDEAFCFRARAVRRLLM